MTVVEEPISHYPVDDVRRAASRELDPKRKSLLGQFMTPLAVARFMAGLFERWDMSEVRLLDAGAGIGSLSAAFLDRWLAEAPPGALARATAYEIDATMRRHLRDTLAAYGDAARGAGTRPVPAILLSHMLSPLRVLSGSRKPEGAAARDF